MVCSSKLTVLNEKCCKNDYVVGLIVWFLTISTMQNPLQLQLQMRNCGVLLILWANTLNKLIVKKRMRRNGKQKKEREREND